MTEFIIAFHGVQEAIFAERILLDSGLAAAPMPAPPETSSSCGICLRVGSDSIEKAKALLGESVSGIYCRAEGGDFLPWNP
jgi:hypothetical protein